MRNKRKLPARGKPKVAVVVDGETEAWYLTMLNRNEPSSKFQIKPEIPQRKSLSEQYEKVDRLSKDYDQVIWIVDMDVILKETREARRGHPRPLEEFLKYMSHLNSISNVTVIINQPCIEIWFLLHFEFTQASFNDCVSAESRLKKYLKDYILEGFKGYLQSYGYAVYGQYGKQDGVTHLCCWAHARREFFDAQQNDRAKAELALTFIKKLYEVEAHCREKNLSSEDRKAYRLDKALPVLDAFSNWLKENYVQVLPKSAIGKAMAYTMTRWEELTNYLMDGMLEIDNNACENKIRPTALGRKNYLFAGSHDAAQRAAMIYSFFAMCKIEDVNPQQWLKFVFDHIMDTNIQKIKELLPKNYKLSLEINQDK
ncbi:IS66 family transposase [Algoriphagus sp. PAP.12]|uniref:IS66 family transposase n=2 Tax=Algoriphagus sp. PAP.12 TaxID=2996678 RepID=UPI00227AA6F1|nr:IS66 family transposase [Algoriphagus sp. PAP.12]